MFQFCQGWFRVPHEKVNAEEQMEKDIMGFIQQSFIKLQLHSRSDTSCYAHNDEEDSVPYIFAGVIVLSNRKICIALDHRPLFRFHSRGVYAVLGSPGKVPPA